MKTYIFTIIVIKTQLLSKQNFYRNNNDYIFNMVNQIGKPTCT